MIVLGVDPSIRSCGVAVVDCSERRPRLLGCTTIRTPSTWSTHSRIAALWTQLDRTAHLRCPHLLAMENPDRVQVGATARGESNHKSPLFLRSTGVPHCIALAHDITFVEVDAADVKKAVGVQGRITTKAQLKCAVRLVCDNVPRVTSEHVDHAIATAIAGARKAARMR